MRKFPATRLSKYPHFPAVDADLWDLFIYINPDSLSWVYYDYQLGKGRPPYKYSDKSVLSNWKYLSSLKIDAVGITNTKVFIYEVKSNGSICGIGQLYSYGALFPKTESTNKEIILTFIVNQIHPDILDACHILNIRVITPMVLHSYWPLKFELYK